MSNHFMRVWQFVDLDNVKEHLLIVGELTADCGKCREVGIKYQEHSACPSCGTSFIFATSRSASGSAKSAGGIVKRLKNRCPSLTFIDYDDFKSLTGKMSARDFFGD